MTIVVIIIFSLQEVLSVHNDGKMNKKNLM
jgi:hypothetical protein